MAVRGWFEGDKGRPRFKKKSGPGLSLTSPDKKAWRLLQRSGQDFLLFPKLGNVPLVLHRPVRGDRKLCRLVPEADGWYAQITTEVPDVDHPPVDLDDPTGIGLDRGVTHVLAAPDGTLTPNPGFGSKAVARTAALQRRLARKEKGSKNRAKARHQLALLHLHVRRQRDHHLTVLAHRIAKNHRVVVIEDRKLPNMTASAKGTAEEPGTNVAQKAGLNRSLLDAAMGLFARKLEQQLRKRGHVLVRVPAAYSSQTCSRCGHVAAENRDRERFRCVSCGHEAQADVNAACVIYSRRTAGEAVCGGILKAGPVKQKPKTARSRTPRKVRAKSSGLQAGDGLLRQHRAEHRHHTE